MAKSCAAGSGDRHQSNGNGQHTHTIRPPCTELTRWWMPFFKKGRCWALSVVALAVLFYYEEHPPSRLHLRLEMSWRKNGIELTRSHVVLAAAAASGCEKNVEKTAKVSRTAEITGETTGQTTAQQITTFGTSVQETRESTVSSTSRWMGLMEADGGKQQQQDYSTEPPPAFDTHRGNADSTEHNSEKDASESRPRGLGDLDSRTASTSSNSQVDMGDSSEETRRSSRQTPSREGLTGGPQESGSTTPHPTKPEEEKPRIDELQMNAFTEEVRSMRPYTRGFAEAVKQEATCMYAVGKTPEPQEIMERALQNMEVLRVAREEWQRALRGHLRGSAVLRGGRGWGKGPEHGRNRGNAKRRGIRAATQTSSEPSFTSKNITATMDQQSHSAWSIEEEASAAAQVKSAWRNSLTTTGQWWLSAPEGASPSGTVANTPATERRAANSRRSRSPTSAPQCGTSTDSEVVPLEAVQQESVLSNSKAKQRQSDGKQKERNKAVVMPWMKKGKQQKDESSGRLKANKDKKRATESRVLRFPQIMQILLQQPVSVSSPSAREFATPALDRQRERHLKRIATLKLLARRFARRLEHLQRLDQRLRRRRPGTDQLKSKTGGSSSSSGSSSSTGSRRRSGTANKRGLVREPVTHPGIDEKHRGMLQLDSTGLPQYSKKVMQREAQPSTSTSARARRRPLAKWQPSNGLALVSSHDGEGSSEVCVRRVQKAKQQPEKWEQAFQGLPMQVQQVKTAQKRKARTQTTSADSIELLALTSASSSHAAPSHGTPSDSGQRTIEPLRHVGEPVPEQLLTREEVCHPDSTAGEEHNDYFDEQCRALLQEEIPDAAREHLLAEIYQQPYHAQNSSADAHLHTSIPSLPVFSEVFFPHTNAPPQAPSNQLQASMTPSQRGAPTYMEYTGSTEVPLLAQLQQETLRTPAEELFAEVQEQANNCYAGASTHDLMKFVPSPVFPHVPDRGVLQDAPSHQLQESTTASQPEVSINMELHHLMHNADRLQSSALPPPLPSQTNSLYSHSIPQDHQPGPSYHDPWLSQRVPSSTPGPFQTPYALPNDTTNMPSDSPPEKQRRHSDAGRQPAGAVVPPPSIPPLTVPPANGFHLLTHAAQQLPDANYEGGVSSQGPFVPENTHWPSHSRPLEPEQLPRMLMTPLPTHPQTVQSEEHASAAEWRSLFAKVAAFLQLMDDRPSSGVSRGSHITYEGQSTTGQQQTVVHSAMWTHPGSGCVSGQNFCDEGTAEDWLAHTTSGTHRMDYGGSSSSSSDSVASRTPLGPLTFSPGMHYTSTESQYPAVSGLPGSQREEVLSSTRPLHAPVQTWVTLEGQLATPAGSQLTVTGPLTDPLEAPSISTGRSVGAVEKPPSLGQLFVDPPNESSSLTEALQDWAFKQLSLNRARQQPSSSSSSLPLNASGSPSTTNPTAATSGRSRETTASSQPVMILPFHEGQTQSAGTLQAPPRRLQQQELDEEADAEGGGGAEEQQRMLKSYAQHREHLKELEDEVVLAGIPFLRTLNPDLRNSPLAAANINTEEEAKLDRVDDGLTETQMLRKNVSCFRTVEVHFTARREKYISLVNREGPTLGMREDEALRLLYYGAWVACYFNAKEQQLDRLLAGRLTDEEELLLLRRTAETPMRFSRRQHLLTEEFIRKFARQYPADDAKVNGTIGVIYSMLIVGCLFVSLLLLHRTYSARRRSRSSDVKQETSVIRLQSDVELSHRRPRSAVGIETSACVS